MKQNYKKLIAIILTATIAAGSLYYFFSRDTAPAEVMIMWMREM